MVRKEPLGYTEFVVLMAAMTALDAFSIDSMVPALAQISADLQIQSANHRQWIINTLFLGFAIGVYLYGFVADSIGRRRPALVAFVIYGIGTIICIQANSLEQMLLGRGCQGFGAAGPYVLSVAIVRDRYQGRQMARIMSLVLMIFITIPIVAPFIGQQVMLVAGWRSIFVVLLIFSITIALWFGLRQTETLAVPDRLPLSASTMWHNTIEVIAHPHTRAYLGAMALVTAAFIAYLATAQQIFQEIYTSGTNFPIIFASLASTIGFSSWLNSRWVESLGMAKLLNRAYLCVAALSLSYLIISQLWATTPALWFYLMYLAGVMFCYGLIFGNLTSLALEPMGHIAGAASSVVNAFATIGAIIIAAVIGAQLSDNVIPVVVGFGLCNLFAWGLTHAIARPAHPPS